MSGFRTLSPEAFAEAFTVHARALWCIAAGVLLNRDQVEDVLQEGAMIALQKLDQFEAGTSFVAWMGRIVRYVALNHGRQRRRSVSADPEAVAAALAGPEKADPLPADARGELRPDQSAFDDEVVDALRSLDDTARSCLLLRTLLEMPYREISRALDIPEGTAMSHVHRARRVMRGRLEPTILAAEGAGGT